MKLVKMSMLLSFLLGSTAMANPMLEPSNYWVGAGAGAAQLDVSQGSEDWTTRSFSGKLDAGFDLNKHLGIYTSYDFIQYIPEDQDIHLGSVGLRGKYGVTDKLDLVAKVGMAYPFSERGDSGLSATFGVGLEYQLTHAISTKVGIDYYDDLSLRSERSGDLTQAYWGMSYRFGQPDTPMVVIEEVIKEVPVEVINTVKSSDVIVVGDIQFKTASSSITNASVLDDVAQLLTEDESLNVRVVGYTDSIGNEVFNQTLSKKRAEAVANYFQQKGILSDRISIEGKGENNPLASNDSVQGRAMNRRVEIFVK